MEIGQDTKLRASILSRLVELLALQGADRRNVVSLEIEVVCPSGDCKI